MVDQDQREFDIEFQFEALLDNINARWRSEIKVESGATIEDVKRQYRYANPGRFSEIGLAYWLLGNEIAKEPMFHRGCSIFKLREFIEVRVLFYPESFKLLRPREKFVIFRRYAGETFRSIGDVFGVSPERIRQIQWKSLLILGFISRDFDKCMEGGVWKTGDAVDA